MDKHTLLCSICNHPRRVDIDQALLTGSPYRAIRREFQVSLAALTRHRNFLRQRAAHDLALREEIDLKNQRWELRQVQKAAWEEALAARREARLTDFHHGLREYSRLTALLHKLPEPAGAQFRVRNDPEWEEAIIAILAVLNKYPDIRQEVFDGVKFLYQ